MTNSLPTFSATPDGPFAVIFDPYCIIITLDTGIYRHDIALLSRDAARELGCDITPEAWECVYSRPDSEWLDQLQTIPAAQPLVDLLCLKMKSLPGQPGTIVGVKWCEVGEVAAAFVEEDERRFMTYAPVQYHVEQEANKVAESATATKQQRRDAADVLTHLEAMVAAKAEGDINEALEYAIQAGAAYERMRVRQVEPHASRGKGTLRSASMGGRGKNAEHAAKRKCYQDAVDAAVRVNKRLSYTRICEIVGKQFGVSAKTVARHTTNPKRNSKE